MKRTVQFLIILVTLSTYSHQSIAQKANYETNGGMTIGFGMGASYQQSDIANPSGGGFDFTLGSYIYKRENAFLAVDWKFRFLAGENTAHDHRINTDMTFSNIKYSFFNYDAELGLTLNSLKERTRIVVTAFAGAGITHGRTFTDLYDANGALYDYSVINTNQDKELIYADLLSLSDRDYETPLINKAAVWPTAGFFIGYQFSRSFSLGIEHKTTFSLTEQNGTTGIDIDNKILPGSGIDMNHYTALSFKWSLGGSGSSRNNYSSSYSYPSTVTRPVAPVSPPVSTQTQTVTNRPPVRENTPISNSNTISNLRDDAANKNNRPPATPLPVVRFVDPSTNITVVRNVLSINVRTQYVKAWQDVTVRVNNVGTSNFNFSNDGIVSTNIGLREGANTVVVTAKNESGTGQAQVRITYNKPVTVTPQPENASMEIVPSNTGQNPPVIAENPPRIADTRNVPPRVIRPEFEETRVVEPEVVPPPVIEQEPQVEEPVVAEPELVEPEIVEQEAIEPEAVDPQIIEPEVVTPVNETCGTRINPGNSVWQFCLVTPNGTITRDNLSDESFSYSGPASSLYFLPIGGGSDAVVNGKPYSIKAGQYYLFTGNLTVTVSTKNPGSMGQWSVCITADKEPVSGNGNNRPVSPCEETAEKDLPNRNAPHR